MTENIFEKILNPHDSVYWNREMSADAQDGEAKYWKIASIATLARDFNRDMADIITALPATPAQATTDAITAYGVKIRESFELMMNETLLGRGE